MDEDYGGMYIATNDSIGLVTDGQTFEELLVNLKEALDVCLEDVDTVAEYHLEPDPKIKFVRNEWNYPLTQLHSSRR